MILTYQLQHKENGAWHPTPYMIKLEVPAAVSHLLNMTELGRAFTGVLQCSACEDLTINYEETRVVETRVDS